LSIGVERATTAMDKHLGQLRRKHLPQLRPGDCDLPVHEKVALLRYRCRRKEVVTRDHDHPDHGLLAARD
jgi:hypothetical protein